MSCLMLCVIVSQNLFARIYEGTCWKYGWSVAETMDRGFVVAGHTHDFGLVEPPDFIVFRLDPAGMPVWVRTYGGPGADYACPIIRTTRDPGYVFAGWTNGFGAGGTDFLVIKVNENGDILWAKAIGGPGDDWPYSIIETPDYGLVIAGWTNSFGNGSDDFLILKLSEGGEPLWAVTFGSSITEQAYSTTLLGEQVLIAGATNSFTGSSDALVLSLDHSTGAFRWAQLIGWDGADEARSIVSTPEGGFVIAGETSRGAGSSDVLVLSVGSDGSPSWARTVGGTDGESGASLARTTDGGFVIGGLTRSFSAGARDFFTFKLDGNGTFLWANSFGGPDDDWIHNVVQTFDGGCAIVGSSWSFGVPQHSEIVLLKLNQDGNYVDCLVDVDPIRSEELPNVRFLADFSKPCDPAIIDPQIITYTADPQILNACEPLYEGYEEDVQIGSPCGIMCVPDIGSAFFFSRISTDIAIYSCDGRVAYSGQLQKGGTRIKLDRGVYLWRAGPYTGKAVIR